MSYCLKEVRDKIEMKQKLLGVLPKAAIYEQLAEECAELSKAALKRARQLRGDNPTPVTENEARSMLREEAGDVKCCLYLLDEEFTPCDSESKMSRWLNRLRVALTGSRKKN